MTGIIEIILIVLSYLVFLLVFASLVKDDYWLFKALEYPRLQKFVIVVFLLAGWALFWWFTGEVNIPALIVLLISLGYLVYKIFPYTTFNPKEVKNAVQVDKENQVKIFTANVLQDNEQYGNLIKQIRECDPDVIMLMEADHKWYQAMKEIEADYTICIAKPLDNTYGMILYSKLQIEEGSVQFLVKEDIPSIEGKLILPSGHKVHFWGLHPKPPVPNESMSATAKDKELMKVAFKVKDTQLPAIVFGDLNDVAWSHTTVLFRRVSRLLDPRRGRGFFSTFSAETRLVRFPLDYLFCSKEFALVSMKRFPYNGSDHFPIFIHLVLQPEVDNENQASQVDKKDAQEAKEIAFEKED